MDALVGEHWRRRGEVEAEGARGAAGGARVVAYFDRVVFVDAHILSVRAAVWLGLVRVGVRLVVWLWQI